MGLTEYRGWKTNPEQEQAVFIEDLPSGKISLWGVRQAWNRQLKLLPKVGISRSPRAASLCDSDGEDVVTNRTEIPQPKPITAKGTPLGGRSISLSVELFIPPSSFHLALVFLVLNQSGVDARAHIENKFRHRTPKKLFWTSQGYRHTKTGTKDGAHGG